MLEIAGDADGLLDEPLVLRLRGAGEQPVLWRARLRDDDGRVWRAEAETPEALAAAWRPAKQPAGAVAALRSLRPVQLDVRADAADGRGASRTLTRRLLAAGATSRRWRGDAPATLYLPAGDAHATVIAEAAGEDDVLAAALLASHGVRVVLATGRTDVVRERAAELLGTVPAEAGSLPLPPGVPATADLDERMRAWHALLARVKGDGQPA